MIRTQISLDEQAYRDAKTEAKREGISLAAFLRRAVAVALSRHASEEPRWMRHAGALASGDPDASATINDVVYKRGRP
jgi:hypothetical protein